MLPEPTTLATVAKAIAETLQTRYGVAPEPVLRSVGLSSRALEGAGARCRWAKIRDLWNAAAKTSRDPCFGLNVGRSVRPTSFHAVGFSCLASRTLLDALHRLSRYHQVISTVPVEVLVAAEHDSYVLSARPTDTNFRPPDEAVDAYLVAVLELCRSASTPDLRPQAVHLVRANHGHVDAYVQAFDAPVHFSAVRNALFFERKVIEATLLGENQDLARANDEVAEHYLSALDPQRVSSDVKKLLVDLLPTGEASAREIAGRLHKSVSTLQRQLRTEHTSYKEIAEDTRRALAEDYVRQGKLSLSQIAYLLGFSDQSNFSRAFRRWTGVAPREYRTRALNSLRGGGSG